MLDAKQQQNLNDNLQCWCSDLYENSGPGLCPKHGINSEDSADDGLEVEVIRAILKHHPLYQAGEEAQQLKANMLLDQQSHITFRRPYQSLNNQQKHQVRLAVARLVADFEGIPE